ncbi:MAG TPA: phosphatase PAP2 family protein [Acidimicrobiia bacterium]|jgi:hypothetical protein
MHWLPATDSGVMCAAAAVVGVPMRYAPNPTKTTVAVGAILRELAMVLGLYTLWMLAGHLAVTQDTGAVAHGQSLWNLERTLQLPNEHTLQQWALHSHLFVRLLNTYYAFEHVPSLIIFLLWLFFRHRDRYPRIRNVLALTTLACLLIQLIPVAPPRLVPDLHMIDTGKLLGPDVYTSIGHGGPDQFSAMPSVHIAWAALFTWAVITVSPSKWRWLMLFHLALVFAAVTFTGYHYWLDGIVSIIIIAVMVQVEAAGRWAFSSARALVRPPAVATPD